MARQVPSDNLSEKSADSPDRVPVRSQAAARNDQYWRGGLAPEPARQVVLIVEDDYSIREIVRRVLEMEGYVTHTANNGAEGLERFYLTLPDLIILDVKMPEMDGWEALKALRKVSECPVIMLTVFGSTEDIVKGFALGADDYLVKPFGIREFTARVSMLLRRTSPVL